MMSRWNAGKKIYEMAKRLQRQRGGFAGVYLVDAIRCGYRHQASPENYFVLRFYELSDEERGTYLTSGRSAAADKKLNRFMTGEKDRIMSQKHLFYRSFSDWIRREAVYVPEITYQEFTAFLDAHKLVVLKPDRGIMGHGIEILSTEGMEDRKALFEKCRSGGFLVEQVIGQHEALGQISDCVNSVRINAARDRNGGIHLIGACLKCGASGATADNFHSGGVAYPLDMETGVVTGPGRNNTEIRDYEYHPGSSVYMPGFSVPHWEAVRNCALQAMERMPELGYVGWDIAVTPEGPELIEGNCHWPGGNIIQLDRIGKYPLIKECLEGVT